jgi:iron(III) transport system substrate-binding protein
MQSRSARCLLLALLPIAVACPLSHAAKAADAIPAAYCDTDVVWRGLTRRARVVCASERVKLDQIAYEDLADPKWHGKVCIRSGQHVYNVALAASMIAAHGETWKEQWLKGVKENLARKPAGDDRLRVKGVYSGECDIAVGNTCYMGADNALKLMEFLASDDGQEMYAEMNNEYPVKESMPWSPLVKSWGPFKPDPISLNEIAALRKKASELIDKVEVPAHRKLSRDEHPQ